MTAQHALLQLSHYGGHSQSNGTRDFQEIMMTKSSMISGHFIAT